MATYYLKSGSGAAGSGTFRGMWVASTAYVAGDRVTSTRSATAARQFPIYECTTGGTAGGSEPTWDATPGNTTTDNTVTWTARACTTWANAHMWADMLAQGDGVGDTIYVSHNHAETTAATVSINLAGTGASPTKLICGNDSAEPPTAVATTAVIASSAANNISITPAGSAAVYGLNVEAGSGANAPYISIGGVDTELIDCTLKLVATGSATIRMAANRTRLTNCNLHFTASTQRISQDITNNATLYWKGGSLLGTCPANLINANSVFDGIIEGVDLSAGSSTMNLISFTGSGRVLFTFRNCKLPGSWTGGLTTGTVSVGSRVAMHNCDSGDTNYRLLISDYAGTIQNENTIVLTGGASDGTTTISWKMVSTANAEYPHITLDTPEIVRWNETTGSAITVTVETVTDNVTLTDGECWVEVMYLGTSGVPLGSFINDAKADVLATAANQTTSAVTWTTTGLTTPVKQKLAVTFTPQEKGYIHAVVKLAKASTTVYVDPELTVT